MFFLLIFGLLLTFLASGVHFSQYLLLFGYKRTITYVTLCKYMGMNNCEMGIFRDDDRVFKKPN